MCQVSQQGTLAVTLHCIDVQGIKHGLIGTWVGNWDPMMDQITPTNFSMILNEPTRYIQVLQPDE